jgi:hypothetical protein
MTCGVRTTVTSPDAQSKYWGGGVLERLSFVGVEADKTANHLHLYCPFPTLYFRCSVPREPFQVPGPTASEFHTITSGSCRIHRAGYSSGNSKFDEHLIRISAILLATVSLPFVFLRRECKDRHFLSLLKKEK